MKKYELLKITLDRTSVLHSSLDVVRLRIAWITKIFNWLPVSFVSVLRPCRSWGRFQAIGLCQGSGCNRQAPVLRMENCDLCVHWPVWFSCSADKMSSRWWEAPSTWSTSPLLTHQQVLQCCPEFEMDWKLKARRCSTKKWYMIYDIW